MTLACSLPTPGWRQAQVPGFGCGIRSQALSSCCILSFSRPPVILIIVLFRDSVLPLVHALAGVERQIIDQRQQVRRKYESETMVLGPRRAVELYLTVVR
jgi:hypothetical protein